MLAPPVRLPNQSNRVTKSPLRVTIVSDAIAGRNGVGTYYDDLAQHLRAEFDSVSLICPSGRANTELHAFSIPLPGDQTQRLCAPRPSAFREVLSSTISDVFVIPTVGPYSHLAVLFARKNGIPFIYAKHTDFRQLTATYWPRAVASPTNWLLQKYNAWFERGASMIVSVGNMQSDAVDLAHSAESNRLKTPLSKSFFDAPIKSSASTIRTCIFVGRLAPEKRVHLYLEAARQCPHIDFQLAGDGPLKSLVLEAASRHSNIQYLGWLHRDEVREAIDGADLLVLPSHVESFGTVALEALARERFVLVSRSCGILQWPGIGDGVFQFDNHESIAHAIDRITAMSTPQRVSIASNSWESVRAFQNSAIEQWRSLIADAARISENCGPFEFKPYEGAA